MLKYATLFATIAIISDSHAGCNWFTTVHSELSGTDEYQKRIDVFTSERIYTANAEGEGWSTAADFDITYSTNTIGEISGSYPKCSSDYSIQVSQNGHNKNDSYTDDPSHSFSYYVYDNCQQIDWGSWAGTLTIETEHGITNGYCSAGDPNGSYLDWQKTQVIWLAEHIFVEWELEDSHNEAGWSWELTAKVTDHPVLTDQL